MDADAVAKKTMADFDADADGALSAAELKAFPPLASTVSQYDANNDGSVSASELADRLKVRFASSASLVGVQCTVTIGGRPLVGAQVVLRPAAALGDALQSAEGTTDDLGVAAPSIPATQLPAGVQGGGLVFPGWYHVEITHAGASLPTRYNTATELGWDVDPTSRTGTAKQFDLKLP